MSRAHMDETKARYQKRRAEPIPINNLPEFPVIGQPPKMARVENSNPPNDKIGLLHQILNGQVSLESMRNGIAPKRAVPTEEPQVSEVSVTIETETHPKPEIQTPFFRRCKTSETDSRHLVTKIYWAHWCSFKAW